VAEITLRKYRKGSTITVMGGPATDVYIVVRGQIGISRSPTVADLPAYATLGPGSIFGESALLVGMKYKGFAHALIDALCVVIPQDKLPELANTIT
jgi:CRP-like cAMP-binding protein